MELVGAGKEVFRVFERSFVLFKRNSSWAVRCPSWFVFEAREETEWHHLGQTWRIRPRSHRTKSNFREQAKRKVFLSWFSNLRLHGGSAWFAREPTRRRTPELAVKRCGCSVHNRGTRSRSSFEGNQTSNRCRHESKCNGPGVKYPTIHLSYR